MLNRSNPNSQGPGLLPIATFVLWTASLAVGIVGFLLHHSFAASPPRAEPVQAELLNVQTIAAQPPADASPPAAAAIPPQSVQPPTLPPIAPPSAPPVFSEPVDAPIRTIHFNRIPTSAPAAAAQPSAPVIQLTFGQGEGQQPAPDYPDEARFAGQVGTVVVRFSVDETGEVTDAEAISPSHWPLLNSAAVRAIRHSWRFRPGPKRVYEVPIEFHLNIHEEP